jgi:hypothetical protein
MFYIYIYHSGFVGLTCFFIEMCAISKNSVAVFLHCWFSRVLKAHNEEVISTVLLRRESILLMHTNSVSCSDSKCMVSPFGLRAP